MKLPTELLFLTTLLLAPATTAPTKLPHRRSAAFSSVIGLTPLTHDFSNSESFSHPNKFFHESTFSYHYDGRFASAPLPHHTRVFHLRLMLQAYTSTMTRIGIRTWLMHGCLLGWWWNARIMPWDTDIDFMVDESGMRELGNWWNMSVHHYPHFPVSEPDDLSTKLLHDGVRDMGGKKYLLEVNPRYTNASTKDRDNVIDARWIDTSTGLFIDITTLHVQPRPAGSRRNTNADDDEDEDEDEDEDQKLYTKDRHAYSSSQIFPLRKSTFEDTQLSIPYGYEALLLDEYGPKAITQRKYRGWRFDMKRGEWVRDEGEVGSQKEEKKGRGREHVYMVKAGR
jgi:hypothetical protein